jgi:HlyD family secretion protein
MEPNRPSSPPTRHWRISVPVSLGILLLLASLVVAAMSLDSHTGRSSAPSTSPSTSTDNQRWYSLGCVDIEGGVTQLYPVQPGRVKSIEARENESVKAGQPLFHLEDTVQVFNVRKAEAALKGAKKQQAVAEARVAEADTQIAAQQKAIDAANTKVKQAQLALKRQRRLNRDELNVVEELQNAELTVQLAEIGVKAEQMKLDAAKSAKRVAESLVGAARANVDARQVQLDEARKAVDECVVRSPEDGIPLRININVGETLGSNPRQPAIQFAAQRPLLVRAEVEQEFVDRLAENQNVVIEDNVTGKECARGKVANIARWYAPRRTASPETLMMSNDARTLECIIKIDSFSREIRIGQRVRVQFTG